MTHANDVRIAEGLRDIDLPDDPALALGTWRTALNDAIVTWYRSAGCDIPDLNDLDRPGHQRHQLLFPALLHVADLQQRLRPTGSALWVRRRPCSSCGR